MHVSHEKNQTLVQAWEVREFAMSKLVLRYRKKTQNSPLNKKRKDKFSGL